MRRCAFAPSPDNEIEVRSVLRLPNGPVDEVSSDYDFTAFDVTPNCSARVTAAVARGYIPPAVLSYCVCRSSDFHFLSSKEQPRIATNLDFEGKSSTAW